LLLPGDRSSHGRFNRTDIPRIVVGLHLTIATALRWMATRKVVAGFESRAETPIGAGE
jgi:hypothetical protein